MLRKFLPNIQKTQINCYRSVVITQFFNYSQDLPSAPIKSSDPIFLALKAARSTPDALKIIGIHANHMNQEHVTLSLRLLTNLQNAGFTETDVVHSDEFAQLCKRLKKHIRTLEINELLDSLKAITMFKVRHNSVITMSILHLIKNEINSLSITQLTFLAFLLRQYPPEPIVDALKIALPIVFEAHLKTKLDRTNVAALVDALIFCTKNNVSEDCCDFVVQALCDLDQLDWMTMDPKRARSIALAITDLTSNKPIYERAFQNAIDVFIPHIFEFTFNDIDVLIGSCLKNQKKCPYFIHLPLFEAYGETAVVKKWNMTETGITLRKLNSVGVVNKNLLDQMTEKILEDPEAFQDGRFGVIKTYVAGLSIAHYRTNHWTLLKDLLPASKCFEHVSPYQPWIPLCLDLASLDIFCDKLLARVFNESFLQKYMAREYNLLDYLQLLQLHQAVKILYPSYKGPFAPEEFINQAKDLNNQRVVDPVLRGALKEAMGEKNVLTRCQTRDGILIDYVVLLNGLETKPKKHDDFIPIDDLGLAEDCQKAAVFLLQKNSYNSLNQLRGYMLLHTRVLEEIGYNVVIISVEQWESTPDWEKIPYLSQKIRLKLGGKCKQEEYFLE